MNRGSRPLTGPAGLLQKQICAAYEFRGTAAGTSAEGKRRKGPSGPGA